MKLKKFLRGILLLLLILSVSTLCGCLPSVELNERAIVQAIGIDIDENTGEFLISLQIYTPQGGQSSTEGEQQNAAILESSGATVTEAVQNATLKQGKSIFYGHNRVIIIGEAAAKNGLEPVMSFFNGNGQSRLNTGVLIAKGSACEILKTRMSQGVLPAQALESMADNSRENGKIIDVTYLDIAKAFENETDDAVIPAIAVNSDEENSSDTGSEGQQIPNETSQSIEMSGTAVFQDGKLAGYLNEEETRGLMWLRGDVKKTIMVASTDRITSFSVEIYKTSADLTCETTSVPYTYLLTAHLNGSIRDITLKDEDILLNDADYEAMEQMLCRIVEKEVLAAVDKTVIRYNADVLQLGNRLWQKDVAAWSRVRDQFPQELSQITVNCQITADIDRIGLETHEQGKE